MSCKNEACKEKKTLPTVEKTQLCSQAAMLHWAQGVLNYSRAKYAPVAKVGLSHGSSNNTMTQKAQLKANKNISIAFYSVDLLNICERSWNMPSGKSTLQTWVSWNLLSRFRRTDKKCLRACVCCCSTRDTPPSSGPTWTQQHFQCIPMWSTLIFITFLLHVLLFKNIFFEQIAVCWTTILKALSGYISIIFQVKFNYTFNRRFPTIV